MGRNIRFDVADGRAGSANEIRRCDSERTEEAYSERSVLRALRASRLGGWGVRSLRRDLGGCEV